VQPALDRHPRQLGVRPHFAVVATVYGSSGQQGWSPQALNNNQYSLPDEEALTRGLTVPPTLLATANQVIEQDGMWIKGHSRCFSRVHQVRLSCETHRLGGRRQELLHLNSPRKRGEGGDTALNTIALVPPPRGIPPLSIWQYSGGARRVALSLLQKKQGNAP